MHASRLGSRAVALAALWCQARAAVHTTIAAPCTFELVVKKSRFVALAAPVRSRNDAAAWIRDATDDQARHNCFAYRLADGSVRTNGDGEPGGTAGPPIAAAIALTFSFIQLKPGVTEPTEPAALSSAEAQEIFLLEESLSGLSAIAINEFGSGDLLATLDALYLEI
jgi:hypothetical protein